MIKIELSAAEAEALAAALHDLAIDMDDDGREGAFEASPLAAILRKLRAALRS